MLSIILISVGLISLVIVDVSETPHWIFILTKYFALVSGLFRALFDYFQRPFFDFALTPDSWVGENRERFDEMHVLILASTHRRGEHPTIEWIGSDDFTRDPPFRHRIQDAGDIFVCCRESHVLPRHMLPSCTVRIR